MPLRIWGSTFSSTEIFRSVGDTPLSSYRVSWVLWDFRPWWGWCWTFCLRNRWVRPLRKKSEVLWCWSDLFAAFLRTWLKVGGCCPWGCCLVWTLKADLWCFPCLPLRECLSFWWELAGWETVGFRASCTWTWAVWPHLRLESTLFPPKNEGTTNTLTRFCCY